MKLVVVESPAKAKTLKGYLNSEFEVIASIGHFRDLPKSGMGIDEKNDFNVEKWEVDNEKINPILKLVKKADEVFLAPDPDREGELIAWHLLEICKEKKLYEDKKFSRIEFNQVNKQTVLAAIEKPRKINIDLVNAAIARRFLDRFFGYRISPITQRRTIFGKSAGRVQSPALRLLANREMEIDKFSPKEFWEICVELENDNKEKFLFKLIKQNDLKIEKHSIINEKQANQIVSQIKDVFNITKIERKNKKRNPYPPFSASTLLQDASSKLGFSSAHTTTIAQQLFDGSAYKGSEQGLITYPRSDSIVLNDNKINLCRDLIKSIYCKNYVPDERNFYKNKAKFAQESHEPISPVNLKLLPEDVQNKLNSDQFKLYDLIWKRTVASQMKPSVSEETTIFVESNKLIFKTSGSVTIFDGYKKAYNFLDSKEKEKEIPAIRSEKEKLNFLNTQKKQLFTSPPNRFSEAGLIKKLEELGIGRPSTYASIIKKLKEKNYVEIKNKALIPNAKGKILSKFLENFFNDFVEYEFTAELEKQLDLITRAEIEWKEVLKNFLKVLNDTVTDVEKKSISNVIDIINKKSDELLKSKKCPKCKTGEVLIKFAFNGPFLGCSNYNKDDGCKYSNNLDDKDLQETLIEGEKLLGIHPKLNKPIKIKKGRYGLYLELESENKDEIKRSAIPRNKSAESIDLEEAVEILKLPRLIGYHPETQKKIIAAIGPFGPYIKHETSPKPVFVNLKEDDVLFIGLNRALELITEKENLDKGIEIGLEPKKKLMIKLKKARFGYFLEIENGKNKPLTFTVPRKYRIENINLDEALNIINAKEKKTNKKNTKK